MTPMIEKVFVSACGAIGAVYSKIFLFDLFDHDTYMQMHGYIESFIAELKEDFSSGVVGAIAGMTVLYAKEALKYFSAYMKNRIKCLRANRREKKQLEN